MTACRARASWASLACLIAGCGSVDPSGSAPGALPLPSITVGTGLAREQILSRGLDDTPRSLDPDLSTDVPGQRVLDDLFEGLTTVDISGKAAAGVASSWENSADGKTWVFHLRRDARWSNGAPLTAADFVYSWRRVVDPRTGAEYAQGMAAIDNALAIASGQKSPDALGVEALDAHTLRVRLSGPTPYLLDLLSQQYAYPVYQPAITQYGDRWVRPEHMVCNGPFVLRENLISSRITLERNANYWDAAHVRVQRVTYYIASDRSVQVSRFLAGDVDWTDSFPSNQYPWLKSVLGDQVVNSPYFGTYMLGMNFTLPPFKDNLPLRQSLVLAIDREPLARYMRLGIYQPAYTLVPPLPGYQQPRPGLGRTLRTRRGTRSHAGCTPRPAIRTGTRCASTSKVRARMPTRATTMRRWQRVGAACWAPTCTFMSASSRCCCRSCSYTSRCCFTTPGSATIRIRIPSCRSTTPATAITTAATQIHSSIG